MSEIPAADFSRRVRNNGTKLKNIPNWEELDDKVQFADYISKEPTSWAYVPENPDEVDVEAVAEEMYEIYEALEDYFDEVEVERVEDEMYWAEVTIEVPDDSSDRERLAEEVAEVIRQRQQM